MYPPHWFRSDPSNLAFMHIVLKVGGLYTLQIGLCYNPCNLVSTHIVLATRRLCTFWIRSQSNPCNLVSTRIMLEVKRVAHPSDFVSIL